MAELLSWPSPDDADTPPAYAIVARDDELSASRTSRKPRGHDSPQKHKAKILIGGPGRRGVQTRRQTANPLLGLTRRVLRSTTRRKNREHEPKTFRDV